MKKKNSEKLMEMISYKFIHMTIERLSQDMFFSLFFILLILKREVTLYLGDSLVSSQTVIDFI